MTDSPVDKTIFDSPSTAQSAGRVYYGVMFSGVLLVPMLIMAFLRFEEPLGSLSLREFFWAFSMIYLTLLVIFKGPTKRATKELRMKLGPGSPTDVTMLTPVAANSSDAEIVALGQRYWHWQLVAGYLTGAYFSWVGGIFFVFVL